LSFQPRVEMLSYGRLLYLPKLQTKFGVLAFTRAGPASWNEQSVNGDHNSLTSRLQNKVCDVSESLPRYLARV